LLKKNKEQVKQLLVWIQKVISSKQLRDSKKSSVLWFNTFLKKNEFLSEIGKLLLSSFLCNLKAMFAVAIYCAKNLLKAGTIFNEIFCYNLDNYASLSKRYIILNY